MIPRIASIDALISRETLEASFKCDYNISSCLIKENSVLVVAHLNIERDKTRK